MAATEANATPAVQEDGKNPESKQTEAEEPAQKSETVNSQAEDKDGTLVNSEVIPTKDSVAHDAPVEAAAAESGEEEAAAVGGEAEAAHVSENHEHKTSFLDSFLNKSGLGKVMSGRKKKEASAAAGAASEESAAEGAEKDQEKTGDEPAATAAAEGAAEGGSEADKTLENGDKEDEKKCKESKSSVRDLIRKPVAKIFSHRSTEKKDGNAPEPPKQVKVRSKSLDRLEDAEALQAAADSAAAEEAAGAEAEAETDPKASSSSSSATKHMKRWHSFKKLMAQKAHKRSNAGGEDGGGGDGEGGGDSSTLDSKESGQKRWKLKRSWTFQGLKRDPSMAGISGKAKSADKEEEEEEEGRDADGGAEGAGAGEEEDKADAGEEKVEASEDDKASGGASVTQHANDIWTSFKKRVIPKSKRANTECHPGGGGDEDAAAAAASGEDGAAEDGKDGKSARAKRSHFGRAVSLKNFILRKGKSASVDAGDAAKEDEEEAAAAAQAADGEGELRGDGKVDVQAAGGETGDDREGEAEAQTTPAHPPVTNGENGCENGTGEDDGRHHRELDDKNNRSPVTKSKELGGAKEETNAKVLNAAAPPVNSEQKAGSA